MMERRRLSLQLTPLLDLLLIVIFAQHLEVIHSAQSVQQELNQQKSDIAADRQRLEDSTRLQRKQLEAEYALRKADVDRLREEYRTRFESVLDQQQQAASVLSQAFRLPGELVEQLSRLRADGSGADADRLQTAAQRLRELLNSRGTEFLRFLIRYDEMQKHVTIWEIHLQDNGQAFFTDGERTQMVSFESGTEFAGRIFEASKSFSVPRTLVLVLLTYADTQAGQRRQASDAMPDLMERLRRDAANTHWFEFSLMGFRPQGPILAGESSSEAVP